MLRRPFLENAAGCAIIGRCALDCLAPCRLKSLTSATRSDASFSRSDEPFGTRSSRRPVRAGARRLRTRRDDRNRRGLAGSGSLGRSRDCQRRHDFDRRRESGAAAPSGVLVPSRRTRFRPVCSRGSARLPLRYGKRARALRQWRTPHFGAEDRRTPRTLHRDRSSPLSASSGAARRRDPERSVVICGLCDLCGSYLECAHSVHRRHRRKTRAGTDSARLAQLDRSPQHRHRHRERREFGRRFWNHPGDRPATARLGRGRHDVRQSHLGQERSARLHRHRATAVAAGELPRRRPRQRQLSRAHEPGRDHRRHQRHGAGVHVEHRRSVCGRACARSRRCANERGPSSWTSTPKPPPRRSRWVGTSTAASPPSSARTRTCRPRTSASCRKARPT